MRETISKTRKMRGIRTKKNNPKKVSKKKNNPHSPEKPNFPQSKSKACWRP
jgi:hypothetical protein